MTVEKKLVYGLYGLLICFISPLFAWQTPEVDTIVAEGRYIMGDRDSRQDAKEYALLDAKKKVMEQAGTFLRSSTTVQNYQMSEQEIQAYTAGLIRTEILEEHFEPLGETMAAVVKIRAVVDPREVEALARNMEQEGEKADDISQLQGEYHQLALRLDSLKSESGGRPGSRGADYQTTFRKLHELDLLTRMAMEARRRNPDIKYLQSLIAQYQRLHPNFKFVKGYLGIAYFKHHQPGKAIHQLKEALPTTPGKMRHGMKKLRKKTTDRMSGETKLRFRKEAALFHYYLARSYRQQGNRRQALKHLQQAKRLNPNGNFRDL